MTLKPTDWLRSGEGLTNRSSTLKGYLSAEMEKSGITKVKGIFNVSIQQSSQPRLMIEDEAKIPECYYIAQPPKIDNAALKDNLKKGTSNPRRNP